MESRQTDKPDALHVLVQQIEKLKQVLANIIQNSKLDKDGEYETVFVSGPNQTLARAYWNTLTRVKDFIINMDRIFYPTMIKAGLTARYIKNIFEEIDKEYSCGYVLMTSSPDTENLSKLSLETNSAYIHVVGDGKQRLFYVHKKTCVEIQSAVIETLFDIQNAEYGKKYVLLDEHLKILTKKTGHKHLRIETNNDTYLIAKAVRELLDYYFDSTTARYRPDRLNPLVNKLKKTLPISLVLMVVKIFLPDLPKDFSVDTYLDETNTQQSLSLNAHLKTGYDSLVGLITEHESKQIELAPAADSFEQSDEEDKSEKKSESAEYEQMDSPSEEEKTPSRPEPAQEKKLTLAEKMALIQEKQAKLKDAVIKLKNAYTFQSYLKISQENTNLLPEISQLQIDVESIQQKRTTDLAQVKTQLEADEKIRQADEEKLIQQKQGLEKSLEEKQTLFLKLNLFIKKYNEIVNAHKSEFFAKSNIDDHLNTDAPVSELLTFIGECPISIWSESTHSILRTAMVKTQESFADEIKDLRTQLGTLDFGLKESQQKNLEYQAKMANIAETMQIFSKEDLANSGVLLSLLQTCAAISLACVEVKQEHDAKEEQAAKAAEEIRAKKRQVKAAKEAKEAKEARERQVDQWKTALDSYLQARNQKYKHADNIKRATVNAVSIFNTGLAKVNIEINFSPGYRQRRDYIVELKNELDVYAKSGDAQALSRKITEGVLRFKPRVKDTSKEYQQTLESLLRTISDGLDGKEEPEQKYKL